MVKQSGTFEVCIKLTLPEVSALSGHLRNVKMAEDPIWLQSGINLDIWILEMLQDSWNLNLPFVSYHKGSWVTLKPCVFYLSVV